MSHLSLQERIVISEMRRLGSKQKEIAEQLGRPASTISRELARNSRRHDRYRPLVAHHLAVSRRRRPSVVSKLEQHPDLLTCQELLQVPGEPANDLSFSF